MIDVGTLIIAHLVGDYLWQNDWQAQNKQARLWPCIVHAQLYTLAFTLFTWSAWPVWAYAVIGGTHFLIDHFALAKNYMDAAGQRGFKEHMAPWSIIIVDNSIHLVIAFAVLKIVSHGA